MEVLIIRQVMQKLQEHHYGVSNVCVGASA